MHDPLRRLRVRHVERIVEGFPIRRGNERLIIVIADYPIGMIRIYRESWATMKGDNQMAGLKP